MSAVPIHHPADQPAPDRAPLSEDADWMADHDAELFARYRGKWVAVYGKRVVGVGATAIEAAQQARGVAAQGSYILQSYDELVDLPHVIA
jgi:hypothetical protein